MKWVLVLVLSIVLLVGGVAVARAEGVDPEIEDSARRWAAARGLPLAWVLATISVESDFNLGAVGDPHVPGGSIGLMQVNWHAHGTEIAATGRTREDLYRPDVNIEWGTKVLAGAFEDAREALAETGAPIPADELMRLRYKGVKILTTLRQGGDPRAAYADTMARWRRALGHFEGLA